MGFTLTWTFLDANSGQPIDGLNVVISDTYTDSNCMGGQTTYPSHTLTTDGNGNVSQSYGNGICGTDHIKVVSQSNSDYLSTTNRYTVGVNGGKTQTFTVYVPPVANQNPNGTVTKGTAETSQNFFSQLSASISHSLGIAQADFEYIIVFGSLVIVLIVIMIIIVKVKG